MAGQVSTDIVSDILGLAQDTAKAIERGGIKATPELCPCDDHAQGSLPPIPSVFQTRSETLSTGIDRSTLLIAPDAISALITSSAAETVVAIEQGRIGNSPEICPCPDHSGGTSPRQSVSYSPESSASANGASERQPVTDGPSQLSLSPDAIISMITASASETVAAIDSGRILNSPEICPCPDHNGVVETKRSGSIDALASGTVDGLRASNGDDKVNRYSDSKPGVMAGDAGQLETRSTEARQIEGRPEPTVSINGANRYENRALDAAASAAINDSVKHSIQSLNAINRSSSDEIKGMQSVERGGNPASLTKRDLTMDSPQGLKARISAGALPQGISSQRDSSAAYSSQDQRPTEPSINRQPTVSLRDQSPSIPLVSKPNLSPGKYPDVRQSSFELSGVRDLSKQNPRLSRVGEELRVSPVIQGAVRHSQRQVISQPRTSGDRLSPLRSTLKTGLTRQLMRDVTRVARLANQLDRVSPRGISLRKAAALLNKIEKSELYKSLLVRSKGLGELLREARQTIRAGQQTRGNPRLSQSFKRALEPLLQRISSRVRTEIKRLSAKDAAPFMRDKSRHRGSIRLERRSERSGPRMAGEVGQFGIKRIPVRIRVRVAAERATVSKPSIEGRRVGKHDQFTPGGVKRIPVRIRVRDASQRKPRARQGADAYKSESRRANNTSSRSRRNIQIEDRLVKQSRRARMLRIKRVNEEIKRLTDIRRSLLTDIRKSKLSLEEKLKEAFGIQLNRNTRARRRKRRVIFDENQEQQVVQDSEVIPSSDPVEAEVEPQQEMEPQAEEQVKMFVSASNDGPKNELSTVQSKELDSPDDLQGDSEGHEAPGSEFQAAYH